jgi:hypothetical protein
VGGPTNWTLNGNFGTDANVNFIGTTDAQDLVFKTNNIEAARFETSGDLRLKPGKALKIGDHNAFNMDGVRNIHIGEIVGSLSTGKQNSFIGYRTGYSNLTGAKNTFIGTLSGRLNTIGNQNVFLGGRAGFFNTEGSRNSFLGYQAGRHNTVGEENTFVGRYAGENNLTGSFNTYVGSNSDGAPDITNATAIGSGASVTQSNSLVLGNNANVGIGTSAPVHTLDVVGDASVSGKFFDSSGSAGSSGQVLFSTGAATQWMHTTSLVGPSGANGSNGSNGSAGATGPAGPAGASGGNITCVAASGNITLNTDNQFVVASGATLTITLPSSPATGQIIHFFSENPSVTSINPNGKVFRQGGSDWPTDTMSNFGVPNNSSGLTVIYNGSKWYPLSYQ